MSVQFCWNVLGYDVVDKFKSHYQSTYMNFVKFRFPLCNIITCVIVLVFSKRNKIDALPPSHLPVCHDAHLDIVHH